MHPAQQENPVTASVRRQLQATLREELKLQTSQQRATYEIPGLLADAVLRAFRLEVR